jgi:hypothetical protein
MGPLDFVLYLVGAALLIWGYIRLRKYFSKK